MSVVRYNLNGEPEVFPARAGVSGVGDGHAQKNVRTAEGSAVETEGMYPISKMASLFDVSRQTLIYYDRIGLFKPAVVNEKGYRFYSPVQIPVLRLICMLRDLGLELEEVDRLVRKASTVELVARLQSRIEELNAQIAALEQERASALERLDFYNDVAFWRAAEGKPTLKEFPARFVVFEPFPEGEHVDRAQLHPTLMRALMRLREQTGAGPMRGWGTMLRREAFGTDEPLAGAGSFVVVPANVDAVRLDNVVVLPAGTYLCMSRWGMPYDPTGIRAVVACLHEHNLRAVGNAFDFCCLDTTSYDDSHNVDFCCIQIPVELA